MRLSSLVEICIGLFSEGFFSSSKFYGKACRSSYNCEDSDDFMSSLMYRCKDSVCRCGYGRLKKYSKDMSVTCSTTYCKY